MGFFPAQNVMNNDIQNNYSEKCRLAFTWEFVLLNWEIKSISDLFPNNNNEINVDKESFTFLYEDKILYSYFPCYYKDINYVYGLWWDSLLPLFSGFDYPSLRILTWYETPNETCILWWCFEDDWNIYISEEIRSLSGNSFAWEYKRIEK